MKKHSLYILQRTAWLLALFVFGASLSVAQKLEIKYEKYQLPNGLTVILHTDKSDPIVAVAIQYHVGSNREIKGRTGFAHLFEHIMFQRSENVPEDAFFKMIQNAGGDLNGGTSNDGTVYYEVVPRNALETVLWLESDRMGYLLNTVTKSSFANQQNVVQNEKRQGVDNTPYGFNNYIIDRSLFPEGHPYNWQVIGEMEDLKNASLEDVKDFYRKWYIPGNATLVIAGDIEPGEVKKLVETYFGEIPAGSPVQDMKPMNVTLEKTKRLYYEDNFANSPRLTMVWPSINQYTRDSYALGFLSQILSSGKKSPFYKVIVEGKKLAPSARTMNYNLELAGKFIVSITANQGTDLDELEKAVAEAFEKFEKDGVSDKDIERIKAQVETDFYGSLTSVQSKSFVLAEYNEYAGDPAFLQKDLDNTLAVTKEDVMRVYNTYIKGKPYVMVSVVPKGKADLATVNSELFPIQEENINQATEMKAETDGTTEEIKKSVTKLDRSKQPVSGPDPIVIIPKSWNTSLKNKIQVSGILHKELPLVSFSLILNGGHLLDNPGKPGVSNLVATLMMAGTKNKTPEELEEAIDMLGASISVSASNEFMVISGNCLDRNFEKTMELVREILLEPRWDAKEFDVAKTRILNSLIQRKSSAPYLAGISFNQLVYGNNHIFSTSVTGTESSITSIQLDDLKAYYSKAFSPSVASFQVAGSVPKERVMKALGRIETEWKAFDVALPAYVMPEVPKEATIYFVDVPGAKQSVIQAGYPSLKRNDPDYNLATTMNYQLGGNFNGMFNMILREEKGFTYGASGYFRGMKTAGIYSASSSVRSNATLESVKIFKESMEKYREGISAEDLEYTKNAILRSNAMNYENLYALLGMLQEMSLYNLPQGYIEKELTEVKNLSLDKHKELARKYIDPSRMIWVVAGDAQTQMPPLGEVGYGDPVLYKPVQ
ncbi:MAG: pitrilysin family protein [Bacteroidales bacterium]